jgi:hypothetical protein
MKIVIDILFPVFYLLALGGLGIFLLDRIFRIKADFFTGFFAGSGLAIMILFAAGLLNLFNSYFFIAFIILIMGFIICGRRTIFEFRLPVDRLYTIPLVPAFIVLLIVGLSALSLPIKNDTLYYHLGLPELWLADGGIVFYSTITYSATALSGELLITPVCHFCSPAGAQFFVFLIGVMAIFALGEFFYRIAGGPRILGMLVLVSVPLYAGLMADAKNDFLAAGFALISVYFYIRHIESKGLGHMALAGIFSGLAASTKTNALIFLLAMVIVILLSRHRLKDIIMFIVAAMVFAAPWYLKALIDTGNPFYPFYDNLFHSPYWRASFDAFNKATSARIEQPGLLNFITAPFRLVFFPDVFRGRLGPLLIVLLPILFFIKPVPKPIKKILFISAIFFIIWYVTLPGARYMMPIIPLLSLVAAYVTYRLPGVGKLPALIVIVSLSVIISLNGVQAVRDGRLRIKEALGMVGEEEFLRRVTALDPNKPGSAEREPIFPYYDIWKYVDENTSPLAKVAILCSNNFRADGYYLNRRYYYLNPTEQTLVDFSADEDVLIKSLKDAAPDFILIDYQVIAEFSPESESRAAPGFDVLSQNVKSFHNYVKQNGQLVCTADRFELYRMIY